MTRPRCGNDPRAQLTDDDRRAVENFKAYLADRAALRDRIAEAIARRDGHDWGPGKDSLPSRVIERYTHLADAVLPPPADQAAVLPAWEAVYEPGNVSTYLIGYANDQNAATGMAEAWLRSQAEVTGRLEWVSEEHLATGRYDRWFELIERHDDRVDTGPGIIVRRRLADETPAAEAYPPAAAGLPAGTLEAAEIGANRLDAWARTPHGRNFLAHALVQLARTGWLRPEPGEPFEPMREDAPSPEPAAGARQDGAGS